MNKHDAPKKAYENHAVQDSLTLLNKLWRSNYRIIECPDPPEAILRDGDHFLWMEHVAAYRTEDEAREQWSSIAGRKSEQRNETVIQNPDERTASAILVCIQAKLNKPSYKNVYEKY